MGKNCITGIEDFHIIVKNDKGDIVFPNDSKTLNEIMNILRNRLKDEDTFFVLNTKCGMSFQKNPF